MPARPTLRPSRKYTAAEADRRRQLAGQRAAYDTAAAAFAAAAAEHNAGIDQFQRDCRAGDPEAVAAFCTLVLDSSVYPEGFPHQTRAVYRPDPKEAVIEWELPPQSVIPLDRDFRYVASRDAIDALPRAEKDIKERYRTVIAQVALRTIHEILVSTPGSAIELVTFYGYVSTKDPASGQPIRPLLLQVSAKREVFSTFVLSELDPVACLKRLNALVSPHPYDLEPVQPTVDFDSLLTQFKFVAGMDVIAGLDSRPDLLAMNPYEFEHLVRQIFEEMGMQAWNTRACARHRRGYRNAAETVRRWRHRRPHLGSPRRPHRRTRTAAHGRHPGLPGGTARDRRATLAAGQGSLVPGVVSELRDPQAHAGRGPDPVRPGQAAALGDRLLRAPLRPARPPASPYSQRRRNLPDHRNRLTALRWSPPGATLLRPFAMSA